MIKKTLVGILLFTVIALQVPTPKSALAQATPPAKYTSKCISQAFSTLLSDVLGQKLGDLTGKLLLNSTVPTKDDATQMQTKAFQFDQCMQAVLEKAATIALQKVKQKVMSDITDRTAAWIRGEDDNQPKFIMNYNDFLNDAKTTALDNVMREIDLSKSPDRNFVNAIKEGLKKKISGESAGTLGQKVDKIEAGAEHAQQLREDFIGNGGIAMLQQIAADENASLEIPQIENAALDEQNRVTQETDANRSGLALSTVECQEWVLVKKKDYQAPGGAGRGYSGTGTEFVLDATGQKQYFPTVPRSINEPPTAFDPSTEWICRNDAVRGGTTLKQPAGTIQHAADKAFVDQWYDSIISSNDLESYISTITDSALFRFQKEGLRMFDTTQGSVGKGSWPNNGNYLSQGTYTAQDEQNNILTGKEVQGEINSQIGDDLKTRAEKIMTDVSTTIREVQSLDGIPMHRIKYLDWLLNATTTPTGGITSCRLNHPFLIGILQQPYPDQIPLSSAIRPGQQAFLPTFNGIYSAANSLRTRANAINNETSATVISQLKADLLAAENNFNTQTQSFTDFKTQLQSYIAVTVANWPPCNLTSQQPPAEQ